MILVTALGSLDVRDEARGTLSSLLAQPRRAALLVYLAIEGGDDFVSRDALLAIFWPESDESRGRAALRQALAFLRRTLGEDAIRTRGDEGVGIDPSKVQCDVRQFLQALKDGQLADALALYRGEFLAGLLVDEAPAFEQWTAVKRTALARDASAAAGHLADQAAGQRDWTRAIALARQAQSLAPFSEEHHRRLLTCLDGAGDRAGALEEHERYATRLLEELEVAPAPETTALVEALRQRRTIGNPIAYTASSDRQEPHAPITVAATKPSSPATTTPRVARASRHIRWAVSLVGVAVIAVAVAVALRRDQSPAVVGAATSRIVVFPLTNETRDTSLASVGRMAADWIIEGISRMDGAEVVPVTAVMTSERMLQGANSGSGEQWQRVAADLGAGVAVRGVIYREGGTLHLQAQLLDVQSGSILRPVERVDVPRDSVIAGIDRLRTRIVAAIAPLADTVTHLRRAVAPPTYESYRLYVSGLETFVRGDARSALALFERSASADSSYPMPRIAASIMFLNLSDANSAERLLAPLRRERARLGPLEQSTVDMAQGLLVGDLAATYDAVVRQARIAPGRIGEYMVAEIARKMNRPAEAVSVLRTLGPDRGELRGWRAYWRELTYALHMSGRHDEEVVAADDARRRYPSDLDMTEFAIRARAAVGDRRALSGLLDALESSAASAEDRAALRLVLATESVAHGHDSAGVIVGEVIAWFDSLPAQAQASPVVTSHRAQALLLSGRPDSARRLLRPLLAGGASPSVTMMRVAGVAAAADGDSVDARRWMAALSTREQAMSAPERGLSWGALTYSRAVIAARLADSASVLMLLRDARRQGLAMDPSVHAEPAFSTLYRWAPFAALMVPATDSVRREHRP